MSFNFTHCILDANASLWDKLSGDTAGHGSRISIETIKLLSLHVVCFVKELVYRAITFREQERILKSETKVWKLSGKTVGDRLNNGICLHVNHLLIFSALGPRTRAHRQSCLGDMFQRVE